MLDFIIAGIACGIGAFVGSFISVRWWYRQIERDMTQLRAIQKMNKFDIQALQEAVFAFKLPNSGEEPI